MTEQQKMQSAVEENVNAAVGQVTKTAEDALSMGRKVTALWLGVTRSAIEAAAKTLSATAEVISTLAESMGELAKRVEGSAKNA
jgi:hypothetical protein